MLTRFSRRLTAIFGAVLLALLLAASAAVAHATAAPTATISGTVLNATHQNSPVAGQQVILQEALGNSARDLATVTTDSQGRFTFGDVLGTNLDTYAVYTHFQGGVFASDPITLQSGGAQGVKLPVYDVTHSDAALRVAAATILFRPPRVINGLIGVGEFVTVQNGGTTAFVGAAVPVNGDPHSLLRFAVPADATQLTPGLGFAGTQVQTIGTGFTSTATVPPGQTQFAFAFNVPYQGTQYTLPFKSVYPTNQVMVLAPPTMTLASSDFTGGSVAQSFGAQYRAYQHGQVAALATLSVPLTHLPEAGQASDMNVGLLGVIAAVLALLALLLVTLYVKRGNLAVVLGVVPAAAAQELASPFAALTAREREAERHRLLRTLLALERERDAGTLTAARFASLARETRTELRALLAAEDAEAAVVATVVATDARTPPSAEHTSAATAATGEAVAEQPAHPPARTGGSR